MEKLREQYQKEVIPALMKKFEYKSTMQVPKLEKIVINIGLGDTKENPKSLENAVNDFNLRIMKPLKNTHMEEQEKEQLLSAVDRAMEKVVNKMLFGLRDSMNEQAFLECVAGLEKTYEK